MAKIVKFNLRVMFSIEVMTAVSFSSMMSLDGLKMLPRLEMVKLQCMRQKESGVCTRRERKGGRGRGAGESE